VKVKVDKTVLASVALHVLVLGWVMLSFSTKALEMPPEESVAVDVIEAKDLSKVMAGIKTGKKENPKPLVEKVAEAKPVDDTVGKISEKPPVVTETAPPPQPKTEEKPVEKKPDPPKVVEKPKEEPKPVEKKPEQKVDQIGDTIKKEEKKPPPPPKPVQAAKPPEPPKQRIVERHFDQSQIAALLDKRDPTRQATTGDTMNSNAALGTAKGAAANNSATWGAMFRQQVLRCWKQPYGSIEATRIEVEYNIKLKRDGSLEATPVAVTSPTTPFQRVFLESGLRAIIECAPYRLPPQYFAEWQAFIPVFDNRDR